MAFLTVLLESNFCVNPNSLAQIKQRIIF